MGNKDEGDVFVCVTFRALLRRWSAGAWAEQLRRDARSIMLARGTGHKSRAQKSGGGAKRLLDRR